MEPSNRSQSGELFRSRRLSGEGRLDPRTWVRRLGERADSLLARVDAKRQVVGASLGDILSGVPADQLGDTEDNGGGTEAGGGFRQRLREPLRQVERVPLPVLLAMLVALGSGLYFFGIGRNRYVSQSSFIVRLPEAPSAQPGGTLLGGILAGPTMLGSLEDGRFLAVYLTSPEVMKRVFFRLRPEVAWARTLNDPFAGLPRGSTTDDQLAFFRRQVQVVPQDLTGVINLRTVGLQPAAAFQLNKLLLDEAEQFMNQTNQGISANQALFAEGEVKRARDRLNKITADYNAFKTAYREVSPGSLAQVTNSLISQLEAKLVDLKVQEASLKRQFRDPSAPEVAYVTDQVQELERQIEEERMLNASGEGKDVNTLQAEATKFETEILVATEALKAAINAADNSRQRSQQQVKFVVRLAEPLLPQVQAWDWRWQGFLATLGLMVVGWGVVSFALGINSRR